MHTMGDKYMAISWSFFLFIGVLLVELGLASIVSSICSVLDVPVVLSERMINRLPRLVFSNNGRGVLRMPSSGMVTEITFTVVTMVM